MKRKLATIAVVASLAATACAPQTEPAPTVTVTETVAAADAEQDVQAWAIAASETSSQARNTIDQWDESECTATGFAMGEATTACVGYLSVIRLGAEAAVSMWMGRLNPDSSSHIESKPESVSVHIEDGSQKIAKLAGAAAQMGDKCPDDEGCAATILPLLLALEDVEAAFSSWPR